MKTIGFILIMAALLLPVAAFAGQTLSVSDGDSLECKFLVGSDAKRYIVASPAPAPVKIDGIFDAGEWDFSEFQGDFKQREPAEGEPASEITRVGMQYDTKNLYIGVRCYDSEPEKIIAREMRRDAIVDDDDYFELILDTYHDHRSAFYFIFNAKGSKRDGVLANEGRNYNPSWDGIWECKAKVNDEGWFAELALPWKTLRFTAGDSAEWGVNFARMIRRKNEHVYWELIPRDMGMSGLFRISEAGNVHGLRDLKMGGNLEMIPYFIGGAARDMSTEFTTLRQFDAGLNAKVAITANMTLDLTFNPDFAQVEADREQINLTRFSLRFPEKREFFLEGAEIFSFGSSMGSFGGGGSSGIELFYSRRIGLVEGQQARILGGAKMVGKVGRFQIGIMNMVTDDVTLETDEGETTVGANNFTVVRARSDVMTRGSIGFMFLNKESLRGPGYNRSLGFDSYLPLTDNITLSGTISGTVGPDDIEDGAVADPLSNLAGNISLGYRSDLYEASASYMDVGADFNPEMGFLRRVDYRLSSLSLQYSPRPENSDVIRQFEYSISGDYRTDHHGTMLDNSAVASFNIRFQDSGRFRMNLSREEEYIDHDWEVRDGYLISEGVYSGLGGSASYSSDPGRPLAGNLNIGYGSYYTGERFQAGLGLNITQISRVKMEIDYDHYYVMLPGGSFHTNTLGLRAYYFISTRLYFKTYLQLNGDRLSYEGREKVVGNFLVRWIYSPGSDLYLVYNDARMIGPGHDEIQNRTVLLKATFFWRK